MTVPSGRLKRMTATARPYRERRQPLREEADLSVTGDKSLASLRRFLRLDDLEVELDDVLSILSLLEILRLLSLLEILLLLLLLFTLSLPLSSPVLPPSSLPLLPPILSPFPIAPFTNLLGFAKEICNLPPFQLLPFNSPIHFCT